MFFQRFVGLSIQLRKFFLLVVIAGFGLGALLSADGVAQDQSSSQQQNPNQQPAPPEAGGPEGGELGPYAIPKKKNEEPPPPPPEKPKKVEGMPDYSIKVAVPVVNLDVSVVAKNGQFIPGLKKDNFKVFEDGVPQTISSFTQQEAPITAVLLVEFASTNYQYLYDALNASYTFASGLKKDDWVAVVSYDMKPQILVDFTQDKRAILGALNTLRIPGFSERNLFDAVYDTLDRLDSIEGHKYIILVSTGRDTFSKINLDQIMKKIKASQGTTIYAISIGRALREWLDAHGYAGGIQETDWLQADNQMNTFAKMTGGRAYFPRFEGELPEIFHDIASDIRNEYNIAYRPTNTKLDGTYRKLKVQLVGPDGSPLKVRDQKGKEVKYEVIAREGYTAKHQVE
jgi:VWFA-related protein